ncbi:MAG TPA: hypothetical protein VK907_12185, partial [Phnomibacter sp.]|nr:hypothetical protein [Phnomibacter sp.]
MIHNANRELMVVLRSANMAPEVMEAETAWLNNVLNSVESPRSVASCSEVLDLTRYKIEKRFERVRKFVMERKKKPFVFLF